MIIIVIRFSILNLVADTLELVNLGKSGPLWHISMNTLSNYKKLSKINTKKFTNLIFLIYISLKPDGVNLWCFKLRLYIWTSKLENRNMLKRNMDILLDCFVNCSLFLYNSTPPPPILNKI